jgi:hypothetical protein
VRIVRSHKRFRERVLGFQLLNNFARFRLIDRAGHSDGFRAVVEGDGTAAAERFVFAQSSEGEYAFSREGQLVPLLQLAPPTGHALMYGDDSIRIEPAAHTRMQAGSGTG